MTAAAPTSPHSEPAILVIFGGAGDLTWRKLGPALFSLHCRGALPADFAIVAVDHVKMAPGALVRRLRQGVERFGGAGRIAAAKWTAFARQIRYVSGDFTAPATYARLKAECSRIEADWKAPAHRVYYMATPPPLFGVIPQHLGDAGLARPRDLARLVVEKPIGSDLASARALNEAITASFEERQIFRIDHYLGKETVQNILAFRFANSLFEPIWDRRYVDYVAVTAAESVGVEHRGGYYDHAGALRDMVQNHLTQLLCLVAMEPMVSFDADEIRNKKVDVLHALRPIPRESVSAHAVRGQYDKGWIGGKTVRGYRDEPGVDPHSKTETFAALRVFIDNWRWQGVPFYLRTGKSLAAQATEIVIQFRAVPHRSFPARSGLDGHACRLVLSIQPHEGILLTFLAKEPGNELDLKSVAMRFDYGQAFAAPSPDAYETLLADILRNDPTLFMRWDQVEAAWTFLTPVVEAWAESPPTDFPNYDAGSWGPETAQGLLAQSGHSWPVPTSFVQQQKARAARAQA